MRRHYTHTQSLHDTVLRVIRKDNDEQKVYPVISGMATGNLHYRVTQDQALSIALKSPHLNSVKPVLERIYGNTRIATRHMAIPNFHAGPESGGRLRVLPR